MAHSTSATQASAPAIDPGQAVGGSRTSGLFKVYIGVWAVLAVAAFGYLTLLTMRPDLVALATAQPTIGDPEAGSRGMSKALAELRGVRQGLGDVQREVAQIKAGVTMLEDRDRAILARLGAVEERTQAGAPTTVSTAAVPKPVEARPGVRTLNGQSVQGQVEERAPSAAVRSAAVAPAAVPEPVPQAIVIGPAVVTAAREPVAVQLASGPSLDSIRLSWSLLVERHKGQLRRLEPRVVAGNGTTEPPFQLIAGPVASPDEAQRLCAALKARKVECNVVASFAGVSL